MRLTAAELLERAAAGTVAGRGVALIVIALNRSDRVAALARTSAAREALGQIAQRVESALRTHDRYAIASYDEIWVLLDGVGGTGQAELAGSTLRTKLSTPVETTAPDGVKTRSYCRPVLGGVWTSAPPTGNPLDLVAASTEACAVAAGSDTQVRIETVRQDGANRDRARIESELRSALVGNDLDVHFQPQIDLATGRCVGAEALVRWQHPRGWSVSPALIAEIAERRGLMGDLTQFVLNNVLRHMMQWSAQGIEPNVSLNLSSVTLADAAYPTFIRDAIATWGVPAQRLTFELTEGLIVRDEQAARTFMGELREMGCKVALDDFGIGYTSFAYLRQFPLDELKIDRAFVSGVSADRGSRRIVQALIDVAHAFDLKALAEGVEDELVAGWLRGTNCDCAQGFHYAAALPADQFADWTTRFNEVDDPAAAAATR